MTLSHIIAFQVDTEVECWWPHAELNTGIHAQPFELWQDAHGVPGASIGPYCPHNSRLFITWHRPYIALFEVRDKICK